MNSETFWLLTLTVVASLVLLAVVIFFFSISKEGRHEYREIGSILTCALLMNLINFIGVLVYHVNMNLVGSVYNTIAFVLFIFLYRRKLNWKNKDLLAIIITTAVVLFDITNLFFFQGIHGLNSYSTALMSGILAILSILYFPQLSQKATPESIVKTPMFWIDTGILIYHGGSFLLFIVADYLVKVLKNNLVSFWIFNNVLWTIFLLMGGYGLMLVKAECKK